MTDSPTPKARVAASPDVFSAKRVAFLSFRLGQSDGVSIVAKSWQNAFESLGWNTITVAGEGRPDRLVPGLEIDAEMAPDAAELQAALHDVDLVVVENLLTIPMNLPASRVVAGVLQGRPAILHHHDPPWQRTRFVHVTELPANDPAWLHVTINGLTQREFAERGIEATTIYNGFDLDAPSGDRDRMRSELGVGTSLLVAHPVRAIGRKDIPSAIRLCEQLGATYWLTGPAEEGYRPELDRILADAACPVVHQAAPTQADIYAAADLVVFPSIWEGFGNPPIEAALHRKPVAVSHYPVAEELRQLGFEWPDLDQVELLQSEIRDPDLSRIEANRAVIAKHLSSDLTISRLDRLLKRAGW